MTEPTIIITGTDTDVGKTVFAAALAGALGASYWKPVQAGLDPCSDADSVAGLSALPPLASCPKRIGSPPHVPRTAPPQSIGITIDPARLAPPQVDGPLVIEGAGGVLVPVTCDLLFADVFARWACPVVLVARTSLGTINHSLLSIEALRHRGVPILAIAFIGDEQADSEAHHSPDRRCKTARPLATARSARRSHARRRVRRQLRPGRFPMTPSPIWHPFTQSGLNEPIPLVTYAEGAALYTDDGRRIVDGISSWWVTTHGHCHTRIMAAIVEQTTKLDQIIFAGWTHEPAETLARGLTAIVPSSLSRVFFSDSGSTSVEVALKMALGYWANRGTPRHRILVMQHSYHGDTIGAMSVGARGAFNASYAPLLFDVGTLPFPAAGAEQATLDALEAACRDAPAALPAALIVEPLILGAGGMLIYPRLGAGGDAGGLCASRRAVHRRRSDDRLGSHRHAARVRASGRRARHPVSIQGLDQRRGATCRDAGDRGDLRRAFVGRPITDVLPLVELHRQPDRVRRGQCQPRDLA